MIDPFPATIIISAFVVIFGILLPILDKTKRFGMFVSLRWCIVVTFVAMFIGVLLDFSHLDDGVRLTVVLGTLIVGGIYILIRTWEKAMANGWSLGVRKIEAQKGDAKVTVDVNDTKDIKQ